MEFSSTDWRMDGESRCSKAVNMGIELAREKKIFCGVIAVNSQGEIGWGANGGILPLAYWKKEMEEPLCMLTNNS